MCLVATVPLAKADETVPYVMKDRSSYLPHYTYGSIPATT